MHEVSLMYEVLLHVEQAAIREELGKVTKIKLTIGREMLVMPEALQFAFETMRHASMAEAVLELEETEGRDFYIDFIEGEEMSG